MNTLKKFLAIACVFIGSYAIAQPGWNWGDSIDVAKEKNALYTDFLRAGNYQQAVKPLEWLIKNTPDLNASIYINGAKIYEGLAESTTDAAQTLKYQERALLMYDLRVKYFGDEADVLNRKAFTSYKFYKGEPTKYAEMMALFARALELNGNAFSNSNITAYMDVVRRFKLAKGKITDEEVFEIYSKITDVIDYQTQNGDKDRMAKISEYVDKLLTSTVQVDCQFVEEKLGPKMRVNKDPKLAKKIFGLMVTQKCTDSPLALEAAVIVNETAPDYAIAKFIGLKSASDGNNEKAKEYFNKAINLTDDNTKKAEIYVSLAKLQTGQGDKVSARSSARRALSFDPSYSDAYKLIGDLYMNSFNDCKGDVSKVLDRAVFIAAYEMYQRAGDRDASANAKAQFPSIEEIFSEGYEEGQPLKVGCWINESVKLERRPAN